MAFNRTPQLRSSFTPGDVTAGYYNDLSGVALSYNRPAEALGWFELFALRRDRSWPVSMVQLGLGAWQLVQQGHDEWTPVLRAVAEWCAIDMDGHGRLAHHLAMPHTFELEPPWFSAMAQGQAASLLVRAAHTLAVDDLGVHAQRAIASLLDPISSLVVTTPEGVVLQEYPTDEPSHVLNGWIWALWGLYDVAIATGDASARQAFDEGVETLARRLPLYETGRNWSRYDLFPHPVVHVASPFYHRLHIEQLVALDQLAPGHGFADVAARWQAGADSRVARVGAVARKVGFRIMRPRKRAA